MALLQYSEIKDIITNKYGYKNLDDWKKECENRFSLYKKEGRYKPTQEEIDLLSPDNVDCGAFWRVCTELFGIDPICNITQPGYADNSAVNMYDITIANKRNLWLTETFGILTYLKEHADYPSMVMEFGAGYGGLKNWIESNTSKNYIGFDVNPLIPSILPLNHQGELITDISDNKGKVSHFVCSNVFQHLSEKQRLYIFDTAATYLYSGGLLMFITPIKSAAYEYIYTYGQITINPSSSWIDEELCKRGFKICMVTSRYDGVVGYIAIKQ